MADSIIEKLRKLFALADESSGAGEHERNVAAAQAAKLMAKYDIDRAAVGDEDSGPSPAGMVTWRTIGRDELWIQILATSVSVGIGSPVEVLRGKSRGTSQSVLNMIGNPVKIEFVQRLAEYLIPQLEIECEAALLRRKEENAAQLEAEKDAGGDRLNESDLMRIQRQVYGGPAPKPWTGADTRKFRQSFLKNAAIKVRHRIEEAYLETAETGTDLVVSDRAANDRFKEENNIKVSQRKTSISDREGAAAGAAASRRVDIMPGNKVEGGGRQRLGAGV